jgi:hypothetical protein
VRRCNDRKPPPHSTRLAALSRYHGIANCYIQKDAFGRWQYTREWDLPDMWAFITALNLSAAQVPAHPSADLVPVDECKHVMRGLKPRQLACLAAPWLLLGCSLAAAWLLLVAAVWLLGAARFMCRWFERTSGRSSNGGRAT